MKHLIVQLSIVFLTGAVFVACGQTDNEQVLSPDIFSQKLSNANDGQLVDVRTPEEFKEGHLKGAVNIDFYNEDFESQIETLDKNKPVFVYCGSGGRSASTAAILNKAGFKEVYDLEGGIVQWQDEGKTLVKD